MRKIALAVSCCLLLSSLCWSQAPPKLSPEVRAFVKEDAPVVALTHVRVIDGTGAVPRTDQTLVIANGKITGMGNAASTKIPEGAKVLDLTGHTVIPGLVGMHDHMYYPAPGGPPALYPEHAASFSRLYLAGGVTSIRTTGSVEPYSDLELKRAELKLPAIFVPSASGKPQLWGSMTWNTVWSQTRNSCRTRSPANVRTPRPRIKRFSDWKSRVGPFSRQSRIW